MSLQIVCAFYLYIHVHVTTCTYVAGRYTSHKLAVKLWPSVHETVNNCGLHYMYTYKSYSIHVHTILTELQCSNVVHEAIAVSSNCYVYIPDYCNYNA